MLKKIVINYYREARDMNYTNLQGIYGIYTKESELLYVGMTARPFVKRWNEHVHCIENPRIKSSQQENLYEYCRQYLSYGGTIIFRSIFSFKLFDNVPEQVLQGIEFATITLLKPIFNVEGKREQYRFPSVGDERPYFKSEYNDAEILLQQDLSTKEFRCYDCETSLTYDILAANNVYKPQQFFIEREQLKEKYKDIDFSDLI